MVLHPTGSVAKFLTVHLGSPGADRFVHQEHELSILPTFLSGREQAEVVLTESRDCAG